MEQNFIPSRHIARRDISPLDMTKEKFKEIRENMGLTQTQFAHKLGYDNFSSIHRKEKGISPISKQDEIIIEFILIANLKQTKS